MGVVCTRIYDRVQSVGFQQGFFAAVPNGEIMMTMVRRPVLSGSWYPADPKELAASVDHFLAGADPAQLPAGQPWLAVTPHAGHAHCGPVAGRLFGLLGNWRPDNIIILAPNHRMALTEIALPEESAFATPLGEVPINTDMVNRLAKESGFALNPAAHAQEHAIEIVLPFIQRTWPGAAASIPPSIPPSVPPNIPPNIPPSIVPMLVPMSDPAALTLAGRVLRQTMGKNDLLLVSSDFTHYGRSFGYVPFTEDIPMALERLDAGAILKILGGDAQGLLQYGKDTGITMCGLAACCVAMSEGPPLGYEAVLLDYGRSADKDGDYSFSVSYAALLLTNGKEMA